MVSSSHDHTNRLPVEPACPSSLPTVQPLMLLCIAVGCNCALQPDFDPTMLLTNQHEPQRHRRGHPPRKSQPSVSPHVSEGEQGTGDSKGNEVESDDEDGEDTAQSDSGGSGPDSEEREDAEEEVVNHSVLRSVVRHGSSARRGGTKGVLGRGPSRGSAVAVRRAQAAQTLQGVLRPENRLAVAVRAARGRNGRQAECGAATPRETKIAKMRRASAATHEQGVWSA